MDMDAAEIEYYANQPAWFVAVTDMVLICAILAALALLLRSRWAVPLYALSVAGIAVTAAYDVAAGTALLLHDQGWLVLQLVTAGLAVAQLLYAQQGHDGKPAGLYATVLRSDPGKRNGLYWVAARGEKRSPLGDLLADAAEEGKSPFHGYRFKILKPAQSNGFALVAWPAEYDSSGVMTFMVSDEGIVREKDRGPDTPKVVAAMDGYAPDGTWDTVK